MISNAKSIFPSTCFAIIIAGIVTGSLQVVLSVSYAALIYGGSLSLYLGQGLGYALLGALVIATVIALFAEFPGTVGSNQDVSVAIFSIISASIASEMSPDAPLESVFITVVIVIALSVLLTGLFFLGLGFFRLGGLVRYFPYPVVGGFLAGTGWLLLRGGFNIATGEWSLGEVFDPSLVVRWLPGLLFAVILLLVIRRFQNSCFLPGLILAGTLVFYAIAWLVDLSPALLSTQGFLLGPFSDHSLWQPLSLSQLSLVDWRMLPGQVTNIITVITVSSIALLLNASAFELESKQNIALNKELRLAGVSNLLSCMSPGFVGFRQLCLTSLNFRMGAQSRCVGLIGAAILVLALFFGASIISYFPKSIMGGVLMYLGLTFLVEWAYETWFKLPKVDCCIIWLVLLVIVMLGFMPGIGVGLAAALVMFVVSYSRTEVVRYELTGKKYQSMVPRRADQRQVLDAQGDSLYILQLQGFIFFGTADRLFNQVKKKISKAKYTQLNYVVLDFQRVAILDSTGMLSFRKLKDLMNVTLTHLVITAPSPSIKRQLIQGGLPELHALTHYFSDLNGGVEWCEEQILKQAGESLGVPVTLEQQLSAAFPEGANISPLFQYLERMELTPGTPVLVAGEAACELFLIESGQVETRHKKADQSCSHTEIVKNGRVVGDLGFYLGQTSMVDVCTAEASVLYRISLQELQELQIRKPEIASMLHQTMARLLAERVEHLVKMLNALQK